MNFKTKALSVFSAAILGIGVSSGVALAQEATDDDTIDITIAQGELAVELTMDLDATVQVQAEDETVNGSANIEVEDTRGVEEGWTVTASATDFIDGTWTADSIAFSDGSVDADLSDAEYVTVNNPTLDTEAVTLLEATDTTIAATYTAGYSVGVTVPGGTAQGDYTSTIVVTASGPDPGDPE